MEPNDANYARAQGFGEHTTQRLPLPQPDQLNAAQLAAAAAIISGPRKALFGPFVPLLQTPVVMERIGALGETLRFGAVWRATPATSLNGRPTRRWRSRQALQRRPSTICLPGAARAIWPPMNAVRWTLPMNCSTTTA